MGCFECGVFLHVWNPRHIWEISSNLWLAKQHSLSSGFEFPSCGFENKTYYSICITLSIVVVHWFKVLEISRSNHRHKKHICTHKKRRNGIRFRPSSKLPPPPRFLFAARLKISFPKKKVPSFSSNWPDNIVNYPDASSGFDLDTT